MRKEFRRRSVKQRPSRHFATARGPNPACLHQHIERALRYLHAPNRLDLGASRRLMIGDDRERLDARPAQLARFLAVAAEQMRHVAGRLEMPAIATPYEFDPTARIIGLNLLQDGTNIV